MRSGLSVPPILDPQMKTVCDKAQSLTLEANTLIHVLQSNACSRKNTCIVKFVVMKSNKVFDSYKMSGKW